MLDGGLSRVPQPVDRRTARRPNSSHRQPETQSSGQPPQPANSPESNRPPSRQTETTKSSPKPKKWLIAVITGLFVVGLGGLAWVSFQSGVGSAIDRDKNQAVLLANGQTYFGQLEFIDGQFAKLSDVFYVQSDEAAAQAADDGQPVANNNMQLIKRGQEVFGPEDAMMISRDQIMYFENIKDDSQVSQLMREYQANN